MLAAGRGRRIAPLSRTLPKPLLPVLDRPLIAWQLAALAALGVREVVVVVGYLRERIQAELGDGAAFGLALRYVVQAQPLGIADALACATPVLTRPFLCLLGDVWFEPSDLARVAQGLAGADGALAVHVEDEPRELARNFAVEVDGQGWVRRVEEKPRAPRTNCKGTGLYAFRPAFLEVARGTPPSALRGERELTDAIQRYLEQGAELRAVTCAGRDFNLSAPADLLAVNLHALARSGQERWIAPTAEVHDGAVIEGSVVLGGARVARGARLERALVLPGERVPAGDYRDVLFAAGEVVACSPRR